MMDDAQIKHYLAIAKEHLSKAYIPYSHFPVAAVLVTNDDKVFTGVNIENVSFGATICAERVAIVAAVNAGYQKGDFKTLFVTANTESAIAPCSLCRQVFVEFFESTMPVYLSNRQLAYKLFTVEELVPYAFESLSM